MKESLQFVKGSINQKGIVPELSHFKIKNNRIYGFNGLLCISAPINFDINCNPQAAQLVKAIDKSEQEISFVLKDNNRLVLKSGKFKSSIPCLENEIDNFVEPKGDKFPIDGEAFIQCLKKLEPFTGYDASRPWSHGLLFSKGCCFVTNNVTLIQYWLGFDIGVVCNIPSKTVKELIRVKKYPQYIQTDYKNVGFLYEDDSWICSSQYSLEWPDVLKLMKETENCLHVPEELYEALNTISQFTDASNNVFMKGNIVSTSIGEDGTQFELTSPITDQQVCYNMKTLQDLKSLNAKVDFSHYPAPCPIVGENFRGLILGPKINAS